MAVAVYNMVNNLHYEVKNLTKITEKTEKKMIQWLGAKNQKALVAQTMVGLQHIRDGNSNNSFGYKV